MHRYDKMLVSLSVKPTHDDDDESPNKENLFNANTPVTLIVSKYKTGIILPGKLLLNFRRNTNANVTVILFLLYGCSQAQTSHGFNRFHSLS